MRQEASYLGVHRGRGVETAQEVGDSAWVMPLVPDDVGGIAQLSFGGTAASACDELDKGDRYTGCARSGR